MINYYLYISVNNKLTVRELNNRIKSKEYERLSDEIKSLIKKKMVWIILLNILLLSIVSEKVLHKVIMEDLEHFLNELGEGFSFVGSEYRIKIGDSYNYIDLLLFNYFYNCFIIVELKVTELRKEYIGQVEVYMNYIDKCLKKINHDKTIGIIVCKKDNCFIMEYCSDKRIFSTDYVVM